MTVTKKEAPRVKREASFELLCKFTTTEAIYQQTSGKKLRIISSVQAAHPPRPICAPEALPGARAAAGVSLLLDIGTHNGINRGEKDAI